MNQTSSEVSSGCQQRDQGGPELEADCEGQEEAGDPEAALRQNHPRKESPEQEGGCPCLSTSESGQTTRAPAHHPRHRTCVTGEGNPVRTALRRSRQPRAERPPG